MTSMDGDTPTQEGSGPDKAASVSCQEASTMLLFFLFQLKQKEKKHIGFIAECTLVDGVIVHENGRKGLKGFSSKLIFGSADH